jgi:hypothetical protein
MPKEDFPPVPSADQTKAALRLAADDHVRRVVDAFPPLTRDQRDQLTSILRGA